MDRDGEGVGTSDSGTQGKADVCVISEAAGDEKRIMIGPSIFVDEQRN
jgi:hypothetical protein